MTERVKKIYKPQDKRMVIDLGARMKLLKITNEGLAEIAGVGVSSVATLRVGREATTFIADCVEEAMAKITNDRRIVNVDGLKTFPDREPYPPRPYDQQYQGEYHNPPIAKTLREAAETTRRESGCA